MSGTKKRTSIKWARVYVAYFFKEARRGDYRLPISVTVLAKDVQEALRLLAAEFPGRVMDGIHTKNDYGTMGREAQCVLVANNLPNEDYGVPGDLWEKSVEERRSKWHDGKPPSEVSELRRLRTSLATLGLSDAHPAMVEIQRIVSTYEPVPSVL